MTEATRDLAAEVYRKFVAVNGEHRMTAADDAYVTGNFATLDSLCAARRRAPGDVRRHMLAGELPLPGYVRSDAAQMVPKDYFRLADEAGGVAALPGWFQRHWADRARGAGEWDSYLSGQYVCLREVTPAAISRKDELTGQIGSALAAPRPDSPEWLRALHALVDELDAITAEFTGYDRLRFGGPVSRDTFISDVRARYQRAA